MSRGAAYQRNRRELPEPGASRETPVKAWLHQGPYSGGSVAVTIPGTFKAMSFTRTQVTKLRKAFEEAEAIFARGEQPDMHTSIDLMKRIAE
jgi:hypothetical protein